MKNAKRIAIAISSLFLAPAWAHGKTYPPEQTGMAMMRLHNSTFSKSGLGNFLSGNSNIWDGLRKNFRMDEVNSALVRSHENKFTANSAYFNRTIQRSTPYMYHIATEVRERNMPAEVALLPFIESAYVTKARSNVGASGLWQFMPKTGRHYGLEQTPLYDGRHDVYAATDAALNYLQYLHSLFGDWSLALAAYNWGEGNMTRAINRAVAAGLPPTYENLRMPNETRNYVPKLLAVRNMVNNPSAFGLKLPEIKSEPYFKAVSVSAPLDIRAAASLANIPESEFLALNPAFKTPVFIPKGNRKMLLPAAAAKVFEENYKNSDQNTLLSWDVFTPEHRTPLAEIASQTGSSVNELQRLNGIKSAYLEAGRSILVGKNRASGIRPFSDFAKADYDPVPDTYVEQTAPVLGKNAPAANFVFRQPEKTDAPPSTIAEHKPALKLPEKSAVAIIAAAPQPHAAAETPFRQPEKTDTPPAAVAENKTTAEQPEPPAPKLADAKPAATDEPAFGQPETPYTELAETDHTQPETPPPAAEDGDDELMALARASQARIRAAEAMQTHLAQSKAGETHNERRQRQLADNKAKTEQPKQPPATPSSYKVGNGDTLYSIAKRHNMDVADLIAANRIKGNSIKPGQILKITAAKTQPQPAQAIKVAGTTRPAETAKHTREAPAKEKPRAESKKTADSKTAKSGSKNTAPVRAEAKKQPANPVPSAKKKGR